MGTRAWLLALASLAVGACGDARQAPDVGCSNTVPGTARCAAASPYGSPARWPVVSGHITGLASRCPRHGEDKVRLTLFRDVAPEVAYAGADASTGKITVIYPSEAYFLTAPSHPLHEGLFGRGLPDETRGRSCKRAEPTSGTVTHLQGLSGGLIAGGDAWLVDGQTQIDAPLVHGVPLIRPGQTVTVTGLRCGTGHLVARRVTVTG